ncbi:MAG TPA: pectin acetylesterase-family hydrolase [Kofleriaceae bacterium]
MQVLVALVLLAAACTSDVEEGVTDQALIPSYIDSALDCGRAALAGNLAPGTQLQRVDISTAEFPDARCNDGTPGVFFFRPSATQAGANRWIIQLQGGGGCRTADDCAARWCRIGTNFGATQMTSDLAPANGIDGDGILYRGPAQVSPFEDANQVLIRYCSSDNWSGRSGLVPLVGAHPITGDRIVYVMDFRGADILDAVITKLRQDGVPGLIYTQGGANVPLPDLDAASRVVLAGASAGGAGVINNGDRIQDLLVANDLDGVLDYRLLIDSIFAPNADDLDWTPSTWCTQAVCDWSDIFLPMNTMFERHGDTSCDVWHANAPGTEWMCDDTDHVVRHHVLTPMMVRMGLFDDLLSGNLIASGVEDGAGNPMTLPLFASLVTAQLLALPQIAVAGQTEETAPVAPATFGPQCPKHETLSNNPSTFNTRITKANTPLRMFDVWTNWVNGAANAQVVFAPGDPQVCN